MAHLTNGQSNQSMTLCCYQSSKCQFEKAMLVAASTIPWSCEDTFSYKSGMMRSVKYLREGMLYLFFKSIDQFYESRFFHDMIWFQIDCYHLSDCHVNSFSIITFIMPQLYYVKCVFNAWLHGISWLTWPGDIRRIRSGTKNCTCTSRCNWGLQLGQFVM